MTIAARSLYYHCANNSSSYVEQGADGVWPNLAWDLTAAGERVSVDTVEYLYVSNPEQPLPQRFLNARFETYINVSKRMGVQDRHVVIAPEQTLGQVKRSGGPVAFANKKIEERKDMGIDGILVVHDLWHAVPATVDDAHRLDANHDCNPDIREMTEMLRAAGNKVGFWFRPEFTKTSIANVLSDRIPMAQTYYGYRECQYPDVVSLLRERGISSVREHPEWIRYRKDGSFPYNTPYNWVPMSMAGEWWDRIMWPTLVMSKELGFDYFLMDGGFGGLQGVDYSPRLLGKTDTAVPCQPYWWRMFRSMKAIDIHLFGECTTGWVGGNTNGAAEGDEHYIWMFHQSVLWFSTGPLAKEPENVHKFYQLYNGIHHSIEPNLGAVRRYAVKFYEQNRAPDWVELKNLRQEGPLEISITTSESPVAGGGVLTNVEGTVKQTIRPWVWDDVVWHYNDGTSVVYPAYDKIDWHTE